MGIDLVMYDPGTSALARRRQLLRHYEIDVVLDIGANEGQYGSSLRELGFEGRIVSFEPLPIPFARLRERVTGDPLWTCVNIALSDSTGSAPFLVDGSDGQCSSFLAMLPQFEQSLEVTHRHQSRRDVPTMTLDDAVAQYGGASAATFVKMDVQGFEGRILSAATTAYERIVGFQLELSLSPLYDGEVLLPEMINRVIGKGFRLESIEPGQVDFRTGRLLQADCLFFRG